MRECNTSISRHLASHSLVFSSWAPQAPAKATIHIQTHTHTHTHTLWDWVSWMLVSSSLTWYITVQYETHRWKKKKKRQQHLPMDAQVLLHKLLVPWRGKFSWWDEHNSYKTLFCFCFNRNCRGSLRWHILHIDICIAMCVYIIYIHFRFALQHLEWASNILSTCLVLH